MTNYKRIWFPKGKSPKRAFFWSNKKLTVFGALTSSHDFYYRFYESQNSITFCPGKNVFEEWINPEKRYVLILDNAGFHKTAIVQHFIAKYDWICVEHIPPYAPELNPIETCWKVTKHAVTKSQHFKTIDNMQESLEEFLDRHVFTQNFITYLYR